MQQVSFATTSLYGQEFPYQHDATADSSAAGISATSAVGQDAHGRLTDSAREEAIRRAGDALIAAMGRKEASRRRYNASSCLTDKADMDQADLQAQEARRLMEALIRGRSAAQVERMERQRGLGA